MEGAGNFKSASSRAYLLSFGEHHNPASDFAQQLWMDPAVSAFLVTVMIFLRSSSGFVSLGKKSKWNNFGVPKVPVSSILGLIFIAISSPPDSQ